MQAIETYPTFLVIGAQKCGTNWIAQMLSQHPEVCVPSKKSYIFFNKIHKELHFFNKRQRYEYGLEWYKSWFKIAPSTRAAGEFTPNYLWTNERNNLTTKDEKSWNIPELVHKHYPNLKLIVSLRDPVERAISAYPKRSFGFEAKYSVGCGKIRHCINGILRQRFTTMDALFFTEEFFDFDI